MSLLGVSSKLSMDQYGHERSQDFFRGGEHFFKKFSINFLKNLAKIFKKFPKIFKKIFTKFFNKISQIFNS